jgi:circadian clock protein KaiB
VNSVNRHAVFKFRLYVARGALNSAQAITNLGAICRAHLPGRHQIEVVDVFREPNRALADGIFMTPMLVRVAPLPVRKIVGSLSQTQLVLRALGLEAFAASTPEGGFHPAGPVGGHRRRRAAQAA